MDYILYSVNCNCNDIKINYHLTVHPAQSDGGSRHSLSLTLRSFMNLGN